jgi:hypothetical protein
MLYVSSLTDVLSGYLDWHLARLKFMARFTTSLLTLTSSDLWKIAGALKAIKPATHRLSLIPSSMCEGTGKPIPLIGGNPISYSEYSDGQNNQAFARCDDMCVEIKRVELKPINVQSQGAGLARI